MKTASIKMEGDAPTSPSCTGYIKTTTGLLLCKKELFLLTKIQAMKVNELLLNKKWQSYHKQFLRVMKCTIVLMLLGCMHVYADGFSQSKISLRLQQADLKTALNLIEKQSQVRFLYNQAVLKNVGKVSVEAENEALAKVLDDLLAGTGVTYKILEDDLVVLNLNGALDAVDVTVTGKVTDSSGAAISGASVTVKGTRQGTATDASGNFSITAADNATLVISSIGFDATEIAVAGKTVIDVTLFPSSTQRLDEVVVIGYGTAQKRDLTGSIATVKAAELKDKPASNAMNLLQGKVSGLSVVASGRPGAEPDVRIRGTNSINGVKPVYIVDGILNDNINFLNPADIESIEVLKDPSSLAIFGIRGANGAIAITTKKAKTGQLMVNLSTSYGFKNVQDRISLTSGPEFKQLYDEQMANMGSSFNNPNFTANTDWQEEIFQKAAISYNNISITGATEKNKFYLGIGYILEDGVILHEEFRKYTLNFSDELRVNRNLRFGITMNVYHANLPQERNVGSAIVAAPIAPVYDPNGSGLFHTLPAFQRAQVFNPLLSIESERYTAIRKEYRGVGSIYGELDFLKHLTFRAQLYADYGFNNGRSYAPIQVVYNPDVVGADKRDYSRTETSVSQYQNTYPKLQQDYLLTYKNKFGDHSLTAMVGFTSYYNGFEDVSSSVLQGTADVIPNDPRFWYVDAVGDRTQKRGSGSAWEDASLSYLARALYNYQGKYLLNASFRRDGSSQFYKIGNEWKNFYAFGAGWVVTKENFFQNQEIFDYLKVKGSYGVLGSKNIPDAYRYPAYPTLTNANAGVFGNNVINALQPTYLPSADLNWETIRSWEVGIELNTLKNRLHFEAVYYDKKTDDVITTIDLGAGQMPLLSNLGTIQNKGLEFSATWNDKIGSDWGYSISGNFTTIDNKVLKLNQEGYRIVNGAAWTEAGYPIGRFFGYVHNGIYQTATEIKQRPVSEIGSVQPGDIMYKDINGDGKITTDDRTTIGNPTPDFIYGGSINVNWKDLDLGIDLQGVYGNEIYRAWNQGTFADFNYLSGRLERWNGVGSSNWEPILHTGRASNYQNSSYWIEDGSFFRIRNIQLGYAFARKSLEKAKIKSLRIYVNAQNIATFANNTGYTPEIGGSATAFGVDNGTYPVPAIYTFGLNLNF
jgi:TonB-linked SusC/RagA family outer membrane protein